MENKDALTPILYGITMLHIGKMFYDVADDSFGYSVNGVRRAYGDEDFYMSNDDADKFYDMMRAKVFIFEAGLEMDYEQEMQVKLFTDYEVATTYVETLNSQEGFYTAFIRARVLNGGVK